MTISQTTEFMLKGETHRIEIEEVNENSITIKITSDPIFVVLNTSESKEVDIDNDGINDLKLALESIENGEPKITVQEINSSEVSGVNEGFFSKYKTWIIILIIVIILVILANMFFSDDEEIEEEKEEGEKIKIGRYILFLILASLIYWLSRRYTLLDYFNVYKMYIIAGVIILIILILIINYWKDIINFFEEEDEEDIKEKVKEVIEEKKEIVEKEEEKKKVA